MSTGWARAELVAKNDRVPTLKVQHAVALELRGDIQRELVYLLQGIPSVIHTR